jgi:hypothetical protein
MDSAIASTYASSLTTKISSERFTRIRNTVFFGETTKGTLTSKFLTIQSPKTHFNLRKNGTLHAILTPEINDYEKSTVNYYNQIKKINFLLIFNFFIFLDF